MPGVAVTVLGYLEKCDGCGVTALLAEPIERPLFEWTCPACDLRIDGPPRPEDGDPLARIHALVSDFYDVLQRLRNPQPEGALLDTVEALDDGDPEPLPLTPEAAAEAVAGWHQGGYIDESATAQQTANTELHGAE